MDRDSQGQLLHFTATKFIKICQNNIGKCDPGNLYEEKASSK